MSLGRQTSDADDRHVRRATVRAVRHCVALRRFLGAAAAERHVRAIVKAENRQQCTSSHLRHLFAVIATRLGNEPNVYGPCRCRLV